MCGAVRAQRCPQLRHTLVTKRVASQVHAAQRRSQQQRLCDGTRAIRSDGAVAQLESGERGAVNGHMDDARELKEARVRRLAMVEVEPRALTLVTRLPRWNRQRWQVGHLELVVVLRAAPPRVIAAQRVRGRESAQQGRAVDPTVLARRELQREVGGGGSEQMQVPARCVTELAHACVPASSDCLESEQRQHVRVLEDTGDQVVRVMPCVVAVAVAVAGATAGAAATVGAGATAGAAATGGVRGGGGVARLPPRYIDGEQPRPYFDQFVSEGGHASIRVPTKLLLDVPGDLGLGEVLDRGGRALESLEHSAEHVCVLSRRIQLGLERVAVGER